MPTRREAVKSALGAVAATFGLAAFVAPVPLKRSETPKYIHADNPAHRDYRVFIDGREIKTGAFEAQRSSSPETRDGWIRCYALAPAALAAGHDMYSDKAWIDPDKPICSYHGVVTFTL